MKLSCILTSFNRPHWIRHSLQSLMDQTYQDFEVILIDESDEFDIREVLREFKLPVVNLQIFKVTPEERMKSNRLSVNCNIALGRATGDLVTFLADDDYYYPTWFSDAAQFFKKNPWAMTAFGKLVYSTSHDRVFPDPGKSNQVRFYSEPVRDPFNKLDHNQVVHRRFEPAFRWPEGVHTVCGPDAYYFREIASRHVFYPIDAPAAVKRLHPKGLIESQQIYINGFMKGIRE